MTKKEKVEDINVMEGIDFKKNQERIRKEIEKNKKKKRMYNILYFIAIMILICGIFMLLNKQSEDAYKSCVENGMSAEWCEVHVQ